MTRRLALTIAIVLALVAAATGTRASAADLAKGISMGGPRSLTVGNDPNDYRLWGNREYFSQSGTSWVKLWVSWNDLQPSFVPGDRAASWAQLDDTAGVKRLDAQIRAANDDHVKVMLTIYQAFPTWASGAEGPDPLSSKPAIAKLPLALGPDSPWGWFVGYLSARYDGALSAFGPTPASPSGNPEAARIDALEVVNEPNFLLWPQDGIAEKVATMLKTADSLSAAYGSQPIVGPATSDVPDPGAADPGVNTDWKAFTAGVLDALQRWQPRVPLWWSQHNYDDVKYGGPAATSRAKQTIDMLAAAGRPSTLWLTEGGLNLGSGWSDPAVRDAQAAKLAANFEAMRSLPQVALVTQHGINDVAGNDFKSGLRDDFVAARPGPGPPRPAWTTWQQLDGTRPG